MQTTRKNAKTTTTIIAIIVLMTSMMLMSMPAQAQTATNLRDSGGVYPLPAGVTPDFTTGTTAFLSFRPNPVGVNQIILVNLWVTPAIHVSRYFKDFKVTITMPNGEIEEVIMDSYRADGTAWFEWIVDQVGEWKF